MKRAVLALVLAACTSDAAPARVTVTTQIFPEAIGEFVELSGTTVTLGDDGDFQIAVTDDASIPAEGYRVDPADDHSWVVRAHDVLGAQYGLAAALENLGYRFRHPDDPYVPAVPADEELALGVVHEPQVRVRGFQFHTLHPIEPHYALYLGDLDASRRIIDWVIKNRGNFIQWVLLQDIVDPTRAAEWSAFTKQVIDDAHARGLRVGVNVELFGHADLQQAFDLVDSDTDPVPPQIAQRLPMITGLPWDVYDLSFGEFFDADPQAFIDGVNEVASQLRTLAPAAEMHATIHIGNGQRVTYMGQDVPYYFLVKFADPTIVPEIHSVMYYDLFESLGGAYGYTGELTEHRQYLVDRLCANQPVAYFPEDAYWVAFDNSVPMYLPLYVRSRWTDLHDIRTIAAPPPCAPLDEHLVFSSGWEWGFWLHDTAAMRATYELPAQPADAIAEEYAPDLGPDAAAIISDLAEAQHTALMDDKLAAYFAGRDTLLDAARSLGVVSQPDRITFDDLVAGTQELRTDFDAGIIGPLARHIDALNALQLRLDQLTLPPSRWANEVRQGLAIDLARAQFVFATYMAVLDHLAGDDDGAVIDRAQAAGALNNATAIVAARDADLHAPEMKRLLIRGANSTIYHYGYLWTADTLCYWNRELDQVDAILNNTNDSLPGCVL